MEYKQLRPFRAFFAEGTKQKGKLLVLAIQLAELYLKENKITDSALNENTLLKDEINDGYQKSSANSLKSDNKKITLSQETFMEKIESSVKNNKLSNENLKKRKPVVKSSEVESSNTKRFVERRKELKNKESNQNLGIEFPKFSSSHVPTPISNQIQSTIWLSVLEIDFTKLKFEESIKIAQLSAEALSYLRDNEEKFTKDQREHLYAKINEFCCFCRNMNDNEIRILVLQRFGSYLTILIHLLVQINEQKSAFFKMTFENLTQMLTIIRQKTFENVINYSSSLLACYPLKKIYLQIMKINLHY